MSGTTMSRASLATAAGALALVAGGIGFGIARLGNTAGSAPEQTKSDQRKILYWYDPMIPAERHDGPGLSSMGMKLIPRYADDGSANTTPGVAIDAGSIQRLGAGECILVAGQREIGIGGQNIGIGRRLGEGRDRRN